MVMYTGLRGDRRTDGTNDMWRPSKDGGCPSCPPGIDRVGIDLRCPDYRDRLDCSSARLRTTFLRAGDS
jgi:hypothetical protein